MNRTRGRTRPRVPFPAPRRGAWAGDTGIRQLELVTPASERGLQPDPGRNEP